MNILSTHFSENISLEERLTAERVNDVLGEDNQKVAPNAFWQQFTQQALMDASGPFFNDWMERVHPGHPKHATGAPATRILGQVFEAISQCTDVDNLNVLAQPSNPIWEVAKHLGRVDNAFASNGTWIMWCQARNQAQLEEQKNVLDDMINLILGQPINIKYPMPQNRERFLLAMAVAIEHPNIDPKPIAAGLNKVDLFAAFWRSHRELYAMFKDTDNHTPQRQQTCVAWILEAHQQIERTFYEAFPLLTKIFCGSGDHARWDEQLKMVADICGWGHAADKTYSFLYPQHERLRSMEHTHQLTDSSQMASQSWKVVQDHWAIINQSPDDAQWLRWALALDDIRLLETIVERNSLRTSMIDDDERSAARWKAFFEERPNSGMRGMIPLMRGIEGGRLAPPEMVNELLNMTDIQSGPDDVVALMINKSIRRGDAQAICIMEGRVWTNDAVTKAMETQWGISWALLFSKSIQHNQTNAQSIWDSVGRMQHGASCQKRIMECTMTYLFLLSVQTTTFDINQWKTIPKELDLLHDDEQLVRVLNNLRSIVGDSLMSWSWNSELLKVFDRSVDDKHNSTKDLIAQFTSRVQSHIIQSHTSLPNHHDLRRVRKI